MQFNHIPYTFLWNVLPVFRWLNVFFFVCESLWVFGVLYMCCDSLLPLSFYILPSHIFSSPFYLDIKIIIHINAITNPLQYEAEKLIFFSLKADLIVPENENKNPKHISNFLLGNRDFLF